MIEHRIVRQHAPELRSVEDAAPVLTGYGAVFNRYSRNLGGFVEVVAPGTFAETLTRSSVVGLVNHDPNWLLGTTDSRSLFVTEDATGLAYAMTLDMTDPDAQRAAAKIESGKMPGSSFSFRTVSDEWSQTDQGFPLRTLTAVELYDVGPVTMPAYRATEEQGAQTALRSLAAAIDAPFDDVLAAAQANELRKFLPSNRAVEHVDETDRPAAPTVPVARLRRSLDLADREVSDRLRVAGIAVP